ncbi:hypothetical protein [Sorangium sp. So ce385]
MLSVDIYSEHDEDHSEHDEDPLEASDPLPTIVVPFTLPTSVVNVVIAS